MVFTFFAFGVAVAFFISSLILLNYGRRLGLKYLQHDGADGMAGLPAVEGAVFALIGLLVAFTVSGALHRYDERRQLVLQEANAATTAYDRLGLFEENVARDLRTNLREYVAARIELYRMPHDFSLLEGIEVWSREQQQKIAKLKAGLSDGMLATCHHQFSASMCSQCACPLKSVRRRSATRRSGRKAPAEHPFHHAVRAWPGRLLACRVWHGSRQSAQLDSYGNFCRYLGRYALCGHGTGVSAPRIYQHRRLRPLPRRGLRANEIEIRRSYLKGGLRGWISP